MQFAFLPSRNPPQQSPLPRSILFSFSRPFSSPTLPFFFLPILPLRHGIIRWQARFKSDHRRTHPQSSPIKDRRKKGPSPRGSTGRQQRRQRNLCRRKGENLCRNRLQIHLAPAGRRRQREPPALRRRRPQQRPRRRRYPRTVTPPPAYFRQ